MSRLRTVTDFPRNEQGLVDKFIGTAYDVVKEVYLNLDDIKNISAFFKSSKQVYFVRSKEEMDKLPLFFTGQVNLLIDGINGNPEIQTYVADIQLLPSRRKWVLVKNFNTISLDDESLLDTVPCNYVGNVLITKDFDGKGYKETRVYTQSIVGNEKVWKHIPNLYVSIPHTKYDYKELSGYEKYSQDTKGRYFFTAEQEISNYINGRVVSDVITSKAPYIGLGNIIFSDYKVTISRECNIIAKGGVAYLPIHDVVGYSFDKPNITTPFRTKDMFDVGSTTLVYTGDVPLHTRLVGSVSLLVRVNSTDSPEVRRVKGFREIRNGALNLTLRRTKMSVVNQYAITGLSRTSPKYVPETVKLGNNREGSSDITIHDWVYLYNKDPSGFKKIPFESVVGFIRPNSVEEKLYFAGEGYITTEWVLTGGHSKILIKKKGTNWKNLRIQYKDNRGKIHYDSNQSIAIQNYDEHPDYYLYMPTSTADYIRVMYSDDTTPNAEIELIGIDTKYDTIYGTWVKYDMYIDRPYSFEPGEEYQFVLGKDNGYADINLQTGGVLLSHADISFEYNVTNILKGKGKFL